RPAGGPDGLGLPLDLVGDGRREELPGLLADRVGPGHAGGPLPRRVHQPVLAALVGHADRGREVLQQRGEEVAGPAEFVLLPPSPEAVTAASRTRSRSRSASRAADSAAETPRGNDRSTPTSATHDAAAAATLTTAAVPPSGVRQLRASARWLTPHRTAHSPAQTSTVRGGAGRRRPARPRTAGIVRNPRARSRSDSTRPGAAPGPAGGARPRVSSGWA